MHIKKKKAYNLAVIKNYMYINNIISKSWTKVRKISSLSVGHKIIEQLPASFSTGAMPETKTNNGERMNKWRDRKTNKWNPNLQITKPKKQIKTHFILDNK